MNDEHGLPLSQIKLIDLTRARSGPACVRQLGDQEEIEGFGTEGTI
ncbi:MAG: hypothetical protein ACR2HB_01150 [Dehalococcoidia bacterium]